MRKPLFIPVALLSVLLAASQAAYPAKHKKDDVSRMIMETQNKLDAVMKGDTESLVKYEISKIKDQIAVSQKLLASGKAENAYYEISIGVYYFDMIDARIDLYRSRVDLEETQKKLKPGADK